MIKKYIRIINLYKLSVPLALFLLVFALKSPAISNQNTQESNQPIILPNIAKSEKRVLPDDPARDEKLLRLSGNDIMASEIIGQHSLVAGSRMTMVCRREVYSWLVEHIRVSASLSRILGRTYSVSDGSEYTYHGEDGEGLTVDFNTAYSDSASTLYIGKGKIKVFVITVSGTFINFLEYDNIDGTRMEARNCIYVSINNSVARLLARFLLAVSDLEKGIMEKLFALDDTTFKLVDIFMEDPHLFSMLKEPGTPAPAGASEIAVKIRDAIVRESSAKDARELGLMLERARLDVGYK